jgi:hypothetical protein
LQGTEVLLCDGDDTRSSPHPSVVALGCLNGGDERGNGQGRYSSWLGLKTRDGSHNKNRMKRMKRGPHSQQPTKGTSLNWITRGKATSLDWGSS